MTRSALIARANIETLLLRGDVVPGFIHQRRSVKLVALTLNDHLYFPTSAHSRLVGVDRLAAVPGD